jgi:hypothetical protein
MNAKEQRLWDLLARELERTIERLDKKDFPTNEDRTSLLTIGALAGELRRKPPIAMDILAEPAIAVDTRTPDGKRGPFAIWSEDACSDQDPKLADIRIFLEGAWLPLCREFGSIVLTAKAARATHALAKNGSLLGRQLADIIEIDEEKNIGRAIKSAVDRGLIVNAGDKDGYRLTDAGLEWARLHPEEPTAPGDGTTTNGDGNTRRTGGTAPNR